MMMMMMMEKDDLLTCWLARAAGKKTVQDQSPAGDTDRELSSCALRPIPQRQRRP